ncbi:MAG: ABC transporter permease [Clostridia bacterium]|nr:ABC transporter permease [Clostridia bacterium]
MTYLAQVINSTIREITPILLVALCAGICSKVQVFNIALEGTLLTSAFFAFLTHYFLHSLPLAVLVAIAIAMTMSFIMSFFIVKLKGQPMIVGMALNTFSRGFTTFLLSVIFDTKGAVNPTDLKGLTKINLPVVRDIPFLSTVFGNLTVIDYLAFVMAVIVFIIMYRTVIGFRLRALGINRNAASSLGINVKRYQVLAATLAGSMIGLAGCLLTLGRNAMFIQDISGARGYVALAANNLCKGHPLGALLSSALFGFTTALAQSLQGTAIRQQLLQCIPYISTIAAMAVYNVLARRKRKAQR